jgi:aconitate hydratase
MTVYDAAMRYRDEGVPLIVIAGREYGTGSSRDWAAKGPNLLGVGAVIAESFERIHRANLVGMGVLPLQFADGEGRRSLGLTGEEELTIHGLEAGVTPHQELEVEASRDGEVRRFRVTSRVLNETEVEYLRHGGVLTRVLRDLMA